MVKKARPRQVEKDRLEVQPAGSIFQVYCTVQVEKVRPTCGKGQTYVQTSPTNK